MKKFKIILVPVICVLLSVTCFATSIDTIDYYYHDEGITVSFDANTNLSIEQQKVIADKLALGSEYDNSEISTYRLCWLVGHDLSKDTVTSTQHKVYSESPRCVRNVYSVETCSSCDYVNETLISSANIDCCS